MLTSLLIAVSAVAGLTPYLVNKIAVKDAAFSGIARNFTGPGVVSLLITQFAAFGGDSISYIKDARQAFTNKTVDVAVLSTNVKWPNEVSQVPYKIFGINAVLVNEGFFPNPNKATGSVTIFNFDSKTPSTPIPLSTDKKGWFYHHSEWFDVNGDGLLDVVAARSSGKGEGELVWLEQPSSNPLAGKWKETLIAHGPDVSFRILDLDGDGTFEIVAGQFFTPKLVILWCEGRWSTCGPSNVKSKVIDVPPIGKIFDLSFVDLNADGKKDLLVTNNMADGTGGVFVFELPKNWKTDAFTKHVLLTGIKPHSSLPGQGAPGSAIAFWPTKDHRPRPAILVSGDDAGEFFLLEANSESSSDWTYRSTVVCKSSGTIGQGAVEDINGDGITDFFVNYYSEGRVEVYSFKA